MSENCFLSLLIVFTTRRHFFKDNKDIRITNYKRKNFKTKWPHCVNYNNGCAVNDRLTLLERD